ncbi:MAG: 50S ribosomal protein L6, partial [candidate division WWE3 bacterium GW2011_GWC1_47_10]
MRLGKRSLAEKFCAKCGDLMSRIGKQKIEITPGTEIAINGRVVLVKGSKGSLTCEVLPGVSVSTANGYITVSVKPDMVNSDAFWGLHRALIANMVKGVTEGFERRLELEGVGYRVKGDKKKIELSIGFSHPVVYNASDGVDFEVLDNKAIVIRGIDKQLVGLVASKIRSMRVPEPYKGKGIHYVGEVVRRKPGKA